MEYIIVKLLKIFTKPLSSLVEILILPIFIIYLIITFVEIVLVVGCVYLIIKISLHFYSKADVHSNAKPEIDKFLNVKKKTNIIVFDLETNGLDSNWSVLSCTAIKYKIDPITFEASELERFDRYYFPIEPFNHRATEKNRLTKDVITKKRCGVNYPRHFKQDADFKEFCNDVIRFIGHNISFEAKFVPLIQGKKLFCTMKTNTNIVAIGYLNKRPNWKWPTLSETAKYYKIKFNKADLHTSLGDTKLTTQVFLKMCKDSKVEHKIYNSFIGLIVKLAR